VSRIPLFSVIWVLVFFGQPVLAEQQASMNPTPTTPGRPHGQHDPHGKLTAEQHVNVALKHIQDGRKGEAMRTLDMAVAQFPDSAMVRAVRGSVLLQEGRIAPALEDLEVAVRLDPADVQVYVNRANAYQRFGRHKEAMADLNKAIELDRNFVPAYFNRGFMRFNQRDLPGALVDFDQCIAIDPHAPGPYFNRAAVYDSMGKTGLAVADMTRFKELVKDDKSRKMADDVLKSWVDRGTASKQPVAASGTKGPSK
jgi:tetratricopeptide (TPR) repeat protein